MRSISIVTLFLLTSTVSGQETPSYAKHVRPFLAKYCLECHNPKSQKGGLDLESFKAMLEGGNKGDVLHPGKPDESRLVTMTEGKEKPFMPPKTAKHHPKKEEIALLRAWVKAGAKDDGGSIKVALPAIKPRNPEGGPATALAYDPLGRYLMIGRNRAVSVQRLKPDVANIEFSIKGQVTGIAYSNDGDWLAIATGMPGETGSVTLSTDLKTPNVATGIPFEKLHNDVILDLAISPDKKWLATCSYDTRVVLSPLPGASSTKPVVLKDHSDAVYGIAFSPDSKQIATCSADRTVKIWEVETGSLLLTLSEGNDWLYAVAWSDKSTHLAAGGLDRSIRLYELNEGKSKLLHSVFAHEGGVQKLLFSRGGDKLYSLGQEGAVKVWKTTGMKELRLIERQPEHVQSIAVSADQKQIALGRYDGIVVLLEEANGKKVEELKPVAQPLKPKMKKEKAALEKVDVKDPFPVQKDVAGNDSPSKASPITLPASIHGTLDRAGDCDFFRLEMKKGQQLGVQAVTSAIGSKVDAFLQILDPRGKVLAQSDNGLIGHTFEEDGLYILGVRDRELKGGAGMAYRLNVGPIPVVTSIFPLGLKRGEECEFAVRGVFLDQALVRFKAPADALPGTKVRLPITSKHGPVLGKTQAVVGEFRDVNEGTGLIFPGTGNGVLSKTGEADVWTFSGKKGQRMIVEVEGRRLGSPVDSVIEILDMKSKAIERAVLRCQAKTFVTFRDHDNVQGNIRIEAWNDLNVNDFIYMGGELVRIKELPTHPDADCNFFTAGGLRTGFLDTTPTHQSLNEPMYKVSIHPPGTRFPPNGYPVFTLYYRNDDGGPGYGRDSRLFFDVPEDGDYRVRVSDARGAGGPDHGYRVTIRAPKPSFNVRFSPDAPSISRGGSVPITVTADRIDGYDGPIQVRLDNLPAGLHAPTTDIPAGQIATAFALFAEDKAPTPTAPLKLIATAEFDGKKIVKEVMGQTPKVIAPGEIVTRTMESEITLKPGSITTLTVEIERRDKFAGRVPLDVKGLPHGVRVLDIGLNGILINETETRRTIQIYAEPWVEPTDHPIVVLARREGKNTEHGAKSVLLKIGR